MIEGGCPRCSLSAAHPLARLDEDGICAFCRRTEPVARRTIRRRDLLRRMEVLFAGVRERGGTRVLLAYSGGKDSAWTLVQLRERFGVRVRALTVDNGFLSELALRNAAHLASQVGAEHLVVRPPQPRLQRLFARSLQPGVFSATALARASAICNACICMVKSICLREALAHQMDVLVWGWSPGQVPLTSALLQPPPRFLQQLIDHLRIPLVSALGEAPDWFADPACLNGERNFHLVSPLAVLPYDESAIVQDLQRRGWQRPSDVDPNSTNCRLNLLATHAHKVQYGFHPYALELAALVREGRLPAEEAQRRCESAPDLRRLEDLARELDLDAITRRDLQLEGWSQSQAPDPTKAPQ